jgi:hypothetical protein
VARPRLVILDADMLAGWRRATPSLAQLWDAVASLRDEYDDVQVAIVADASLKWALDGKERDQLDKEVGEGLLAYAPAGCEGGYAGFLEAVSNRASGGGFAPVLITDRSIPGATLGKVTKKNDAWVFDLEGRTAPVAPGAASGTRRGR